MSNYFPLVFQSSRITFQVDRMKENLWRNWWLNALASLCGRRDVIIFCTRSRLVKCFLVGIGQCVYLCLCHPFVMPMITEI